MVYHGLMPEWWCGLLIVARGRDGITYQAIQRKH
jgi:hypothetical protein